MSPAAITCHRKKDMGFKPKPWPETTMRSFDDIYHCHTTRVSGYNLVLERRYLWSTAQYEHPYLVRKWASSWITSRLPCYLILFPIATGCYKQPVRYAPFFPLFSQKCFIFFQIVCLNWILVSKLLCHLTALILASWRWGWRRNSKNKIRVCLLTLRKSFNKP